MQPRIILTLLAIVLASCQLFKPKEPEWTPPRSVEPAPQPAATTSPEMTAAYRPPTIRLKYRGTNLSGAEFGSAIPGVHGRDFKYPSQADADYFLSRGMNHFRLPFRHERLQPTLRAPLDETEWARMKDLVDYMTSKGAAVMLEPHNSFRHRDKIVTETEIGDFWGRVAVRFKGNPKVQINITNEPKDMTTEQVVALDNAALREIRRVGFTGLVAIPGNGWTGGGHWLSKWYGTPNATAMVKVIDPGPGESVFEVHQYLDDNADGGGECVSETIGVERLSGFVAWLRANGKKGWLGEIGALNSPKCEAAIKRTLSYVEEHYDVWTGYDWWGSGVWTFATTYALSIGPTTDGTEKPQFAWLKGFLPCAR